MDTWLKKYLEANGGPENFVKDRNCTFLDNNVLVMLLESWANGIPGAERALYTLVMFLEWNYSFFSKLNLLQ